jgi:hypothetical protein
VLNLIKKKYPTCWVIIARFEQLHNSSSLNTINEQLITIKYLLIVKWLHLMISLRTATIQLLNDLEESGLYDKMHILYRYEISLKPFIFVK